MLSKPYDLELCKLIIILWTLLWVTGNKKGYFVRLYSWEIVCIDIIFGKLTTSDSLKINNYLSSLKQIGSSALDLPQYLLIFLNR